MKTKYQLVNIKSFMYSGEIELRALNTNEIQNLIIIGRKAGFYGNDDLVKHIIGCGATNGDNSIKYDDLDISLSNILAREIWLITLKSLSKNVNKLISYLKPTDIAKIRIKPYGFSDLVTPSLLWFIQKDMERIDVDSFTKRITNHMIPQVKSKNKLLAGKEKKKYIADNIETICETILNANHMNLQLEKILPKKLFSSAERFYISFKISRTLDWQQYFNIVFTFNTCVEQINFQSNQLGGVDTSEATLLTGIPSFLKLSNYPYSIPFLVTTSLIKDIFNKNNINISRHYNKTIKKMYENTIACVRHNKSDLTDYEKEKFFLKFINNFSEQLNSNMNLVRRLCYIYWGELSESIDAYIKKNADSFIKEISLSNIPDCYILVEGASEDICFNKFVELLNDSNNFIKVIDCESKQGVYRKYRDVIKHDSYIGSIVTVLDSDAQKEHQDIKRIQQKNVSTCHYIYEKGEFEDLFPISQHVKIINSLYSSGENVTSKDFNPTNLMTAQLKKIIWEKKSSSFDKVFYSNEIARTINRSTEIPKIAKTITNKAIDFANKNGKHNKVRSIHDIDAINKNFGIVLGG